MHRNHVVSTAVVSIGYRPEDETLEVEFAGGGVYDYLKVPKNVYQEFFKSPSKGRFFSERIREQYEFRPRER